MVMGLERLVRSLKSKLRCLKTRGSSTGTGGYIFSSTNYNGYDKVEKSESTRVEMKSRKAHKLIAETLKIADSPATATYAF
ncbi:unnamed protein product [Rhodiola kirilowii]